MSRAGNEYGFILMLYFATTVTTRKKKYFERKREKMRQNVSMCVKHI